MAIQTLTLATFENNQVVITVDYDDVTLVVSVVRWVNDSGAPYSVTWGSREVSIPVGSGSINIPGKRFNVVRVTNAPGDDVLVWDQPTHVGRA